jgi:caa(3)-type oxidase subunit IV
MAKDDVKSKGKKADDKDAPKKAVADDKDAPKKAAADDKDAPKKAAADDKDAPKKAAADEKAKPADKAAPEKAAARVAAKEHAKEAAHDDHGHGDHAHAHAHKGHKVNRREYWVIFVVLFVLTVIEVAVAQIPGIGKVALYVALIGLAVSKAAIVGLYYMHLKHESKYLKLTVALPFAAPAVYALVLIAEGAWRLNR